MCGRYSASGTKEALEETLERPLTVEGGTLELNFNVAPTQPAYVVTAAAPQLVQQLHWGLVPSWSKDGKNTGKLINTRAETALEKPSFRQPLLRQRCWVLADGFYEWKLERGIKVPYRIYQPDQAWMVMAGIWERWQGEDDLAYYSFSILTTAPNREMQVLHQRMPLVLPDAASRSAWFQPMDDTALATWLVPPPDGILEYYPVSSAVNAVRNNGPALHLPRDPAEDAWSLELF